MPDALSQSEVDALLDAVGTSADSSDADGAAGAAPENVQYYDFMRPDRLSAAEVRSLIDVHELVAHTMASALSGALRQQVSCRIQTIEQVSWGEIAMNLPNPTCLTTIRVQTPSATAGDGEALPRNATTGTLAMDLPYPIIFPAVGKLLGDSEACEDLAVPSRPMTDIESRVAGAVMEIAANAVCQIWNRSCSLSFKLERLETNPQLVAIAQPTEMSILATFDVSIGPNKSGLAHLCIPMGPLGALVRRLAASGSSYQEAPATAVNEDMLDALGRVPVSVDVCARGPSMTLRDIVTLNVGQVIDTGSKASDEVLVTVAGKPKLRAIVGEFHGRKAVRVTSML